MVSSKFIHSVLTTFACLLIGAVAVAAPVVVENGAEPEQGLKIVDMTELWRAGGEDDEIFFGNIGAVRFGPSGEIYLLDSQLAEVHVYSQKGEHLRTIGHEGDGPGEMRNPADMFITADGVINAIQSMPGRIVKLTPDGLPAGEATYSQGPDNPGQFGVLIAGRAVGQDMVLAGIRMVFSGGVNQQTYFLARCGNDGLQKAVLLEKKHEVNMAAFSLDEGSMDFVWSRLAVGPQGQVYAGPERNAYLINEYDADGAVVRTITREYKSPPRDDRQKKLARQIIEAVGANYPVPPQEITIEDTEPVLSNLFVSGDGMIWAQTSNGNREAPDGTWVVLDVFAPDGKFTYQVALKGEHDPARDAVFVLPNNEVIVVVGALDAWLNQQGANADEAEAQEGEPLEVISYRLTW
jgi:hypothetical protein